MGSELRSAAEGSLSFSSTVCDYDMDVLRESYELFGKTLIPQFDTDPVHSTTRYREAAATL